MEPLLQNPDISNADYSQQRHARERLHTYIHKYQNEFTAIITFDGCIVPGAFPAFKLQVMSTGIAFCLACVPP